MDEKENDSINLTDKELGDILANLPNILRELEEWQINTSNKIALNSPA